MTLLDVVLWFGMCFLKQAPQLLILLFDQSTTNAKTSASTKSIVFDKPIDDEICNTICIMTVIVISIATLRTSYKTSCSNYYP